MTEEIRPRPAPTTVDDPASPTALPAVRLLVVDEQGPSCTADGIC